MDQDNKVDNKKPNVDMKEPNVDKKEPNVDKEEPNVDMEEEMEEDDPETPPPPSPNQTITIGESSDDDMDDKEEEDAIVASLPPADEHPNQSRQHNFYFKFYRTRRPSHRGMKMRERIWWYNWADRTMDVMERQAKCLKKITKKLRRL